MVQAGALLAVWLLFSGHYDLFHVLAGVASVIVVMLLNRRLSRVRLFPGDVHRDLQVFRVVSYSVWLIRQIVVAALQVARIVLSPSLRVSPSMVEFHADLPNASSQTIVANSITLTPGTVSVDIDHGVFLVHALIEQARTGLLEGTIPARVAQMYGGEETGEITESSYTEGEES